jgi:hypothetical protein
MKPVVLRVVVVWVAGFLLNTTGFSHAYMDEGDVPEPDPQYGQSPTGSKNRKRPLQRKVHKPPAVVREASPTSSEAMILKGKQMSIEGEALKKKGELLMRHGQEWIERGNKKRENSQWMRQQIEKAKGGAEKGK